MLKSENSLEQSSIGVTQSLQETGDGGGLITWLGKVVAKSSSREVNSDFRVNLVGSTDGSYEWACQEHVFSGRILK